MFELAIAVFLILLNGVFALSELSIVSARKPRLKTMAAQGSRGAASALKLSENPGKFLSTVQIGITLIGILAGAFSVPRSAGACVTFSMPRVCRIGWPIRWATVS